MWFTVARDPLTLGGAPPPGSKAPRRLETHGLKQAFTPKIMAFKYLLILMKYLILPYGSFFEIYIINVIIWFKKPMACAEGRNTLI